MKKVIVFFTILVMFIPSFGEEKKTDKTKLALYVTGPGAISDKTILDDTILTMLFNDDQYEVIEHTPDFDEIFISDNQYINRPTDSQLYEIFRQYDDDYALVFNIVGSALDNYVRGRLLDVRNEKVVAAADTLTDRTIPSIRNTGREMSRKLLNSISNE